MLDISIYATISCILLILATVFLMIPSIYWGLSARIQKRGHTIGLLLLLWALFQSTLSLNRWYMDRSGGLFHHSFPYFFMLVALLLLYFTPRGKEFAKHIHPRYLLLTQFTRIIWMLVAWSLMDANQMPQGIFLLGGWMELLALIPCVYLFFQFEKTPSYITQAVHVWCALITLSELVIGYGSIPSPFQNWFLLQPNFAFQHFPFSLIPSVLFPIYLFGNIQGILFYRLNRK